MEGVSFGKVTRSQLARPARRSSAGPSRLSRASRLGVFHLRPKCWNRRHAGIAPPDTPAGIEQTETDPPGRF